MTSLNISLPEPLRVFIDKQLQIGGYSTASEYIRELLRDAQQRTAQARLEALLLEGLESGEATPMTSEDWKDIRVSLKERLARRRDNGKRNSS